MRSDDKTPSLGVPAIPRAITIEEVSPDSASDEIDPDLGIPIKDLNVVDAYWHERGMLACEDPRPSTREEKERALATYRSLVEMMARPPEDVRAERQRRRTRERKPK